MRSAEEGSKIKLRQAMKLEWMLPADLTINNDLIAEENYQSSFANVCLFGLFVN